MIPSKQLLARFRFRPWAGLVFSEEFLSDINIANKAVKGMIEIYRQYKVESIVETAISEKNYLLFRELFQEECVFVDIDENPKAEAVCVTKIKQSSISSSNNDCVSPRKKTRK